MGKAVELLSNGDRVVKDGKSYFAVAATARMLRKRTTSIRKMMWDGELDYVQFKDNGPLYVPAASIVAYNQRNVDHAKA